jgi:hypothetical protein
MLHFIDFYLAEYLTGSNSMMMRKLFSAFLVLTPLLVLGLADNSFATVDAHDKAFIVVKDIQSDEFFVERVPIIGCYGFARGPQLVQFTAEYQVNSNVGCGPVFRDNINYLTCAKVTSSTDTEDYSSFSKMTLDISKCEAKNDPKFITMVRTAAALNFPQPKGKNQTKSKTDIQLTLIY